MKTDVINTMSYGVVAAQSCIMLLLFYHIMRSGELTVKEDNSAILITEIIVAGFLAMFSVSLLFAKLWQILGQRG